MVIAALAALWGVLAIQAWQTPTLLDDWVQLGWLRGRGLGLDLVWQVGRYNYLHGNPRIGDVFLLLVNGPRALHVALTPLAQLALLWAAFVVAFGRRPGLALGDLARALVLQVLIWLASPLPGVLYFYRPFTTNYLFAFAATLGLLAPYRLALARPRPAPGRWWWPPAMLALGWLAGMGNEHTGAAAIAAVAGCLVVLRRRTRHAGDSADRGDGRPRRAGLVWQLAGALGLCVGYAMLLLAPGQAERYAGRAGGYDALGLVASRGVAGCYDIVAGFLGEVQWAVVLVAVAGLAFAAHHARRGAAVPAMSRGRLAGIAALLAGAGAIVVTLFASPVAIERLLFAPSVLVAAALAAVVEHVFSLRRLRIAITLAAAAIFGYHAVRFLAVYHDAYAEHRQRIAALAAAAPGSIASVPPYRTPRSRWYFGDDFRMAGVRESVARQQFGLAGIELSPRPIWAEPTPPERFVAHRVYDPPLAPPPAPAPSAPASPSGPAAAPSFLDAALDELRRGLAVGGWGTIDGHRLVRYHIDATATPVIDPQHRPVRMVDWTPAALRHVYGDGVEDAERRASIHIAAATAPPGWRDAFVTACGRTTRIEPARDGADLVLPLTVDCRGTYTAYLCDTETCWFAGRFWR